MRILYTRMKFSMNYLMAKVIAGIVFNKFRTLWRFDSPEFAVQDIIRNIVCENWFFSSSYKWFWSMKWLKLITSPSVVISHINHKLTSICIEPFRHCSHKLNEFVVIINLNYIASIIKRPALSLTKEASLEQGIL